MTDPTPNGQTWVCGWTDVGANCLAGDPCDPETCGYRPVPPAPSSDERAPFAETTLDRLESFLLDATNPRQDVATRAHGFQIDQAKTLARWLRTATADGSLTAADFGLTAPAPTDGEP